MKKKNRKSTSLRSKRKNLLKNETILTTDSDLQSDDSSKQENAVFWKNLPDYSSRRKSRLIKNAENTLSDKTLSTSQPLKSNWWEDIVPSETMQLMEHPRQSNNEKLFDRSDSPNLEEEYIAPKKIFKPRTRSRSRFSQAFIKKPSQISEEMETSGAGPKKYVSIDNSTDDSLTQIKSKRLTKRLFNKPREKRTYSNAFNFEGEKFTSDNLSSGTSINLSNQKQDEINASNDFAVRNISTDIPTYEKQVKATVSDKVTKSPLDMSNKRKITRSLSAQFSENVLETEVQILPKASFGEPNLNKFDETTSKKKIKSPFFLKKGKNYNSKSLLETRKSRKSLSVIIDKLNETKNTKNFYSKSLLETQKTRKSLSAVIDLSEIKNKKNQNIQHSLINEDGIMKQFKSKETVYKDHVNKSHIFLHKNIRKSSATLETEQILSEDRKSTKYIEVMDASNMSETSVLNFSTISSITDNSKIERKTLFGARTGSSKFTKPQQINSMEKKISPITKPLTPRRIIAKPRRSMQVSDTDSTISKLFENSLLSSTKINIPNRYITDDVSEDEDELQNVRLASDSKNKEIVETAEEIVAMTHIGSNEEDLFPTVASSIKISKKRSSLRKSSRNTNLQESKIMGEQETSSNTTASKQISIKGKRSMLEKIGPAENASNRKTRKSASIDKKEISNNENVDRANLEISPAVNENLSPNKSTIRSRTLRKRGSSDGDVGNSGKRVSDKFVQKGKNAKKNTSKESIETINVSNNLTRSDAKESSIENKIKNQLQNSIVNREEKELGKEDAGNNSSNKEAIGKSIHKKKKLSRKLSEASTTFDDDIDNVNIEEVSAGDKLETISQNKSSNRLRSLRKGKAAFKSNLSIAEVGNKEKQITDVSIHKGKNISAKKRRTADASSNRSDIEDSPAENEREDIWLENSSNRQRLLENKKSHLSKRVEENDLSEKEAFNKNLSRKLFKNIAKVSTTLDDDFNNVNIEELSADDKIETISQNKSTNRLRSLRKEKPLKSNLSIPEVENKEKQITDVSIHKEKKLSGKSFAKKGMTVDIPSGNENRSDVEDSPAENEIEDMLENSSNRQRLLEENKNNLSKRLEKSDLSEKEAFDKKLNRKLFKHIAKVSSTIDDDINNVNIEEVSMDNKIETISQNKSTNRLRSLRKGKTALKSNLSIPEVENKDKQITDVSIHKEKKLSGKSFANKSMTVNISSGNENRSDVEDYPAENEIEDMLENSSSSQRLFGENKSNLSNRVEEKDLSEKEAFDKNLSRKLFKNTAKVSTADDNDLNNINIEEGSVGDKIETISQNKSTNRFRSFRQGKTVLKSNLSIAEVENKEKQITRVSIHKEKKLSGKSFAKKSMTAGIPSGNENKSDVEDSPAENEMEDKWSENSSNRQRLLEENKSNLSKRAEDNDLSEKEVFGKNLSRKLFKNIAKVSTTVDDDINNVNVEEVSAGDEIETISQKKATDRLRSLKKGKTALTSNLSIGEVENKTNQITDISISKEKKLSGNPIAKNSLRTGNASSNRTRSDVEDPPAENEIKDMSLQTSLNRSKLWETNKSNLSKKFDGKSIKKINKNIMKINAVKNISDAESANSNYSAVTEKLDNSESEIVLQENELVSTEQRNQSSNNNSQIKNLPRNPVVKNINFADVSSRSSTARKYSSAKNTDLQTNTANRTSIVDLVSINEGSIMQNKSKLLQDFINITKRTSNVRSKSTKVDEEFEETKKRMYKHFQIQPASAKEKKIGNTKITDFFKKGDLKPIQKKNTENTAYRIKVIDGKVYHRRKLFKGSSWCNDRLYKHIQRKMSDTVAEDGIIIKSEELMKSIFESVKIINKSKHYPKEKVDAMKRMLARHGIITTTFDFFHFVNDFLPHEFSLRVVPRTRAHRADTEVPYDPNQLFKNIEY